MSDSPSSPSDACAHEPHDRSVLPILTTRTRPSLSDISPAAAGGYSYSPFHRTLLCMLSLLIMMSCYHTLLYSIFPPSATMYRLITAV